MTGHNRMLESRLMTAALKEKIAGPEEVVLITGAAGFIGVNVAQSLVNLGYRNLRCLVRPSGNPAALERLGRNAPAGTKVEILRGNLLSPADCEAAVRGVAVIYHLAAGTGEKSYPDAFMNSVVTTRNLLEAAVRDGKVKRIASISSFAVYSNRNKVKSGLLDETSPVEEDSNLRGEAYCYAKLKQDEIIQEYGARQGLKYVILPPGVVYGPGKASLSGRIGHDLGVFLHMGGGNPIPFTFVENCADAIVLAGLVKGVEGEVLNIVDDELPTSRAFLRNYKREVRRFRSIYVPKFASYLLCYCWEKYSTWSRGQLPPVFNRLAWHAYYKGSRYSNQKLKDRLGWEPKVTMAEGMKRFFEACRQRRSNP